jgi:hypothetical protein
MSALDVVLLGAFVVFVVGAVFAVRTRAYRRGPRDSFWWGGGGFGG